MSIRRQSVGTIASALLFFLTTAAGVSSGQTFNITPGGFSSSNVCVNSASPAAGCQILTNGSPNQPTVVSGGILRLNSASTNQHASAWFFTPQPLSTGFTTSFQFRISNTGACGGCSFPADGLAFVIQGDPAGTGAIGYTGNGQNLAYGNNDVSNASGPGHAIRNSLAIELDTYQNTDYSDPNGNHIAVQSCGAFNGVPTPNSADHNYQCQNGQLAKLALQSLPAGLSLSDGNIHTITVNYAAPGACTQGCNNFTVYLDSSLILQTTLDLTQQLQLTSAGNATGAFIGFSSATGALVENNDIISWSFSQLPLAPITITEPLQPTTTAFNYTSTLNSTVDYSQSGLPSSTFNGVFMQGTAQPISDDDFAALVANTPFQGSTCLHQDLGSGVVSCVVTSDLCTNSSSSTPSGANCPNTGTSALIATSNTFNLDSRQKPITSPGYLMAKDSALSCGTADDNTCKGLQNIFQSISGDVLTTTGRTKDFNSLLIPVDGVLQPSTSTSTSPALNQGWTNGPLTVTFNSTEAVPSNNHKPPMEPNAPTVSSISYSVTGANVPSPASGTITGSTGSISLPGTVEGTTTVTYQGLDSVGTLETITSNNTADNTVSTSVPMLTIKVDLTPPTITGPTLPSSAPLGGSVMATYSCADSLSGVALCGPPGSQGITGSSPLDTSTAGGHTFTVNAEDVAGNTNSASAPYTVTPGSTTTSLTGSPNPSAVGQAVSYTFSVTGSTTAVALTGTVTVVASTGESCSAGVAAGACSVTFNTPGTRTVTATYSNDPNFTGSTSAPFTQTVQGALISFSPASVNFGTVSFGFIGARVITVSNPGSAPLFISRIRIVPDPGTDSDDFSQINSCVFPIPAGGKCIIALAFLADDLGSRSASIVVTDNVPGSPQSIPLTANVVKRK